MEQIFSIVILFSACLLLSIIKARFTEGYVKKAVHYFYIATFFLCAYYLNIFLVDFGFVDVSPLFLLASAYFLLLSFRELKELT